MGRVRRPMVGALALASVLTAPGLAHASVPFARCHGGSAVECATVLVPLDRTGATPGEISLAVEELPTNRVERGTIFIVAGGPGQGSAKWADLSRNARFFQGFLPGYNLVAFDNRGTGASGPLSCPGIDALWNPDAAQTAGIVGACGNVIGPSRAFYSTRDHAEDIEAVRQALGVDKISLLGFSYGTKFVEAYALAHPAHVQRLVLDSVVPPEGPDPLAINILQAVPRGLGSLCVGGGM